MSLGATPHRGRGRVGARHSVRPACDWAAGGYCPGGLSRNGAGPIPDSARGRPADEFGPGL